MFATESQAVPCQRSLSGPSVLLTAVYAAVANVHSTLMTLRTSEVGRDTDSQLLTASMSDLPGCSCGHGGARGVEDTRPQLMSSANKRSASAVLLAGGCAGVELPLARDRGERDMLPVPESFRASRGERAACDRGDFASLSSLPSRSRRLSRTSFFSWGFAELALVRLAPGACTARDSGSSPPLPAVRTGTLRSVDLRVGWDKMRLRPSNCALRRTARRFDRALRRRSISLACCLRL
mmetsp:Transcript_59903/g.106209  ORF Transcript_59903/g.106209 Transcript_59903/m.106209 type:complete len:237 (-) Transcript_59903:592-1302(-)